MADLDFRYPLSTAEGTAIPLDVIRPYGIIKIPFTSGSGSSSITIPSDVEVLNVYSDVDCLIQFATSNASASALVDNTFKSDAMYVSADVFTIISPPVDKKAFSIRGISASGNCVVQYLRKWTALALQPQFARR